MIYVEHLNFRSLFSDILPALKNSPDKSIGVFDMTRPAALAARLRGIPVEKMAFRMEDVRDGKGTCIYLKVRYGQLKQLQERLLQEFPVGENDPRWQAYAAKASVSSYDFYSDTKRTELWHALVLAGIAQWHSQRLNQPPVLYLYQRPFGQALADWANGQGVVVRSLGKFQQRPSLLKKIMGMAAKLGPSLFYYFLRHPGRLWPNSRPSAADFQPRLMAEYSGQFNLDRPGCISDLFFLDSQGVQGRDVCLVYNNPMDPVDEIKISAMERRGLTAVARTVQSSRVDERRVPVFRYLPAVPAVDAYPPAWKGTAASYVKSKDYWREFFQTFNIKVFNTWNKYDAGHMAMSQAIKELGGISSIYQRSYESNPSPFFAAGCDVIFGFSPQGFDLHRRSSSDFRYHIAVGYIGDHRFSYLRSQAQEIRNRLTSQGARRILAYFDENSIDDGRWFMGHEALRANYAFWLNKLLEDNHLGIIFKPKVPRTLRQRLGPAASLLSEAQQTGRCYVFEEGIIQGAFPPAAAAMAADFSIQESLWGGTAGIEAALCGAKTLLLDLEGFPLSPLYKLGPRVVFKSHESLWQACQDHWQTAAGNPLLGDWSSMIAEIDPFRDGQAAARLSWCLKQMLEGLRQGQKADTVMDHVAQAYADRWGKDKVNRKI